MKFENALAAVEKECLTACVRYPEFNSAHEGYAVLLEEVDDLWDEVKKRDPAAMRTEAIQVAAMALRFLVDVCAPAPELASFVGIHDKKI